MSDNNIIKNVKSNILSWKHLAAWKSNIRYFFRCFKYAYQRITKGFSDYDVWSLDYFYTRLFADSLRELAKTTMSYPGTEEFPTYESWVEYLNKMADLFEASLEESDDGKNIYEEEYEKMLANKYSTAKDREEFFNKSTPEEEEITSKYCEYNHKLYLAREEKRNEALQMMSKVFSQLWD